MADTQDIIDYYANLLIIQYAGKPKAVGTIQTVVSGVVMDQLPLAVIDGFNLNATQQVIAFNWVPDAGTYTLSYAGITVGTYTPYTFPIEIQTAMNALLGYNAVTVTGHAGAGHIDFTFTYPTAPHIVTVSDNSLTSVGLHDVVVSYQSNQARGQQLDWLGKYVGASRSGFGSSGPITLDDADYRRLIQLAIISNNSGSSLATIVGLLHAYFPNEIFCFDYANTSPMRMGYYINTTLGSQDLIQLFVAEGLLPKPMGVQLSVAGAPTIIEFFALFDYVGGVLDNTTPFNCFTTYTSGDYSSTWLWLDYSNSLL